MKRTAGTNMTAPDSCRTLYHIFVAPHSSLLVDTSASFNRREKQRPSCLHAVGDATRQLEWDATRIHRNEATPIGNKATQNFPLLRAGERGDYHWFILAGHNGPAPQDIILGVRGRYPSRILGVRGRCPSPPLSRRKSIGPCILARHKRLEGFIKKRNIAHRVARHRPESIN